MSQDTKQWLLQNNPPPIVSEDLAQVAKNNDIYKQVCDPKPEEE